MSLTPKTMKPPAQAPAPAMQGADSLTLGGDPQDDLLTDRGIVGLGRLKLRLGKGSSRGGSAAGGPGAAAGVTPPAPLGPVAPLQLGTPPAAAAREIRLPAGFHL